MTYSLVFLAATCMVADANEGALRPVAADTGAEHVVTTGCGCGCENQCLLQRWLGGLHHKSCGCEKPAPCASPCAKPCSPCQSRCNPCPKPCQTTCQPRCNPCPKPCQTACQPRCNPCPKPCQPRCNPCAKPCQTTCQPRCNPCPRPCQTPCRPCVKPCARNCEPCRPAASPCTVISRPTDDGNIKPEYLQKVAIADDGSWVIGQLFYVHEDGGTWIVRYAPYSREDRYGGEVILAHGVDMSNLREGDLAFVRGEIIKQDRASKYVGGPLYRASSVELNERVD